MRLLSTLPSRKSKGFRQLSEVRLHLDLPPEWAVTILGVLPEEESLTFWSWHSEAVCWVICSQTVSSFPIQNLNLFLLISFIAFGAANKGRWGIFHSILHKITFRGWLFSGPDFSVSIISPNKYTMFVMGQILFKGYSAKLWIKIQALHLWPKTYFPCLFPTTV